MSPYNSYTIRDERENSMTLITEKYTIRYPNYRYVIYPILYCTKLLGKAISLYEEVKLSKTYARQ